MPHADTYPGLLMTFELAAQGKSDRDIARALNAAGYRTCGTRGSWPFTKDSVRGMVGNRFYVGELPDGNGGWIKARHQPFVGADLLEQVQ